MTKSGLARLLPHLGRLGRAERWRRTRGRPRVWAHRGASALQPENTMVAFETARDAGADGIELDVRLDRDGTVIVFHDEDLKRLCGRPGRVEDMPEAERKTLRVAGQPVPTLAEVLDWIGTLEVNVEIKAPHPARMGELAARTAKVIRDSGRAEQVLVSSFDPFTLVQFHRHLPDIALAYLFHDNQPLALRRGWVGTWMGASLFHPQYSLCTEQTVKAWHTQGRAINVWTVDDATELERLARLGVDGVFSNDPGHSVRVFAAMS
jgi:glycerophosphoryl diester phosphodiesterase